MSKVISYFLINLPALGVNMIISAVVCKWSHGSCRRIEVVNSDHVMYTN